MKHYKPYIKPYLSAFLLGPLLMIAEVLGEIMLPKMMSLIINHGVAQRDTRYILWMGIAMAFLALVMALGGIGGAYFSAKASICFTSDLRQDLFAKVQKFSFQNIDDFSAGSLVTRLTNDIQQVQNVTMMGLRMMFRAPGMMIGALIMAFIMNPRLAVIILIVIPLLTLAIVTILRTAFPRFQVVQKAIDTLNNGIQEALTNVRVIKSFVREDYEEAKFKKANRSLKDASMGALNIVIMTMPVMMLAMNITTLAVVWYGGNIIIAGDMQVGDLTAFTTYIVQILMSLMMLSMVFLQSSRAMASVKRINEVIDVEIDLTDECSGHKENEVTEGRVEFRNVCFSYQTDRQKNTENLSKKPENLSKKPENLSKKPENLVLDHLNFTALPGQTIGIIGATGSGKTTLVQLIPRLYDVTGGQVLVDGMDVREYSLKHLRNGVGMVLQKNVLFSGSIEENLRWGAEEASMEELRQAADSAQADGFITAFSKGYQSEIDQGGSNVSGGQKQRLCIARALLKAPKILILDDSTSAVDTATEAKIRECFRTSLKDTTKFIIAQRISSVEDADQILVLDDGKIAAMGTHQELLKTCEPYQEIYYSQREREKEVSA